MISRFEKNAVFLESTLSSQQRETLADRGYIVVRGRGGRRWRLWTDDDVEIYFFGIYLGAVCNVVDYHGLSWQDRMLARKLVIEGNDWNFIEKSNIFYGFLIYLYTPFFVYRHWRNRGHNEL